MAGARRSFSKWLLMWMVIMSAVDSVYSDSERRFSPSGKPPRAVYGCTGPPKDARHRSTALAG